MTVVPVLVTDRPWHEAELRAAASRWNTSMRGWCKRHGVAHDLRWSVERSRCQGVHLHGIFHCPRKLSTEAKRHSREVWARLLDCEVDALQPRAIRHHGRGGGVGAVLASSWLDYANKASDPSGRHHEKAKRLLPITGRAFAVPRAPVSTRRTSQRTSNSPAAPPRPWIYCGLIAAITERITMPVSTTKPRKRSRLRGLRVSEVSLCGSGQNKHARVIVAKADDDEDGAAIVVEVVEVTTDERRIGGWAYVAEIDGEEVEDSEGDDIPLDVLREAAEVFVAESRKGALRHGDDHDVIDWRQSVIVDADLKTAWGIKLNRTGWWLSGVVLDDAVWERVKSGELRSLSIGGTAIREPVEKARGTGAMTFDQVLGQRRAAVAKAAKPAAPSGSPASRPGWKRCTDCPAEASCRRVGRCGMEVRPAPVRKAMLPVAVEAARAGMRRISGIPDVTDLRARADRAESIAKARPSDAVAHARANVTRFAVSEATRAVTTPAATAGAPPAIAAARARARVLTAPGR